MEISLTAEAREGTGTGVARRLRASGKVPGVVYGVGGNPTPVAIDRRSLAHALATDAGLNVLIDLKVGSENFLTLARELQRDPLRGDITHVDLLRVSRDQAIEADVPVTIIGNAPGVKEGGVVEHHTWSIRVSAKPADVPQQFEADISSLGLHDHLRVADLVVPPGVEILSDPDEAIVTIATPAALKLEAELDQPDVATETPPAVEGAPAAETGSES